MPKTSISILAFGLVVTAVGAAVVTAMTNAPLIHRPAVSRVVAGFSSRTMGALDTLTNQLTRRFTDRDNVDFGMSRVVRTEGRMHSSPLASSFSAKRDILPYDQKTKTYTVGDKHLTWDQVKMTMHPENQDEENAIKAFDQENCDVAIYTFGQFGLKRSEAPSYRRIRHDFSYDEGMRAKGPAYLHQESADAPSVSTLAKFAEEAWKTGESDYAAAGPEGWHLFAHRISVSDKSCLNCHSGSQVSKGGLTIAMTGGAQKVGDPVGLFVIALKPKTASPAK